jgi:hypothetical protein
MCFPHDFPTTGSWFPAHGATDMAPLLPVALRRLQRAEGTGRGVVAAVALAPAAGALATGRGYHENMMGTMNKCIYIYITIKYVYIYVYVYVYVYMYILYIYQYIA